LQSLVERLLRGNQELREVWYFTARTRDESDAERRQAVYLDALAGYCPKVRRMEGRFQQRIRSCRYCQDQWIGYEEKETDVNIAVALVEDAVLDTYDTALLITADSDLCPAVAAVKRLRPAKRIIAAIPPRRNSVALIAAVDAYLRIGSDKVRNAQLPPKVVTAGGVILERPEYWR
jgi:uncharacterized LabA/DUF88 family protein